jgi:hypothetical protein
MKIETSYQLEDLQIALRNKLFAVDEAKEQERLARAHLDASLKLALPKLGLGKDALIKHQHAKAHHGNLSEQRVASRVVNAFASHDGNRILLRIQLGKCGPFAKSGRIELSDSYASIDIADVDCILKNSELPYY